MKSRVAVVCASPLLAIFAFNCSVPDFCEGAACTESDGGAGDGDATVGDGGAGDARSDADSYVAPPNCNTAQDISPQAACVTESNGLFVNGSAPAGGTGTKAAPFNTIGAAVSAARGCP
jgi:hypothetical protein